MIIFESRTEIVNKMYFGYVIVIKNYIICTKLVTKYMNLPYKVIHFIKLFFIIFFFKDNYHNILFLHIIIVSIIYKLICFKYFVYEDFYFNNPNSTLTRRNVYITNKNVYYNDS